MQQLLCVVIIFFFLNDVQGQNTVVFDSTDAVRIAKIKGGRYYRSGSDWVHAVKLDSSNNVWIVMSTHRKEVHRKGYCPMIITKVCRININPQSGEIRGRYKTKVKTPNPPPYF